MSDNSSIEWTSTTWNVVTGCTRVSEGCDNCYIERTMPFRVAHRRFDQDGVGGTTGVLLHPERQDKPLHWRKPRKVFVNSLADLFHNDVPDGFIARVWEVMAATPQHTYQILTKRPARMRSLLGSDDWLDMFERGNAEYPLPNVHLGVSVENQKWADSRIPLLLATPAAVRWVSAEPLLGPVEFEFLHYFDPGNCACEPTWSVHEPTCGVEPGAHWGLDWIVVGGESGPGARPMDEAWAQRIVRDCRAAGVKVFVKQLGSVLGGKAHHDIATFPAGLRHREYPTQVPA
jgi:protein gp37